MKKKKRVSKPRVKRKRPPPKHVEELRQLRAQLSEAQETLRAIQSGDVDALVVNGKEGERIFTLKSDDQPYRVLVETMNEGAATLDGHATIFYANTCLAKFIGRSLEHTIGKELADFIHADDRADFRKLFAQAKLGRSKGEIRILRDQSDTLPTLFSMSSVNLETGKGVSLVVTDLTEQKRLAKSAEELELLKELTEQTEAAKSAAVEASHLKSAFLANMSHEIRTPLGAMIGFAELLSDPNITEGERESSIDVLKRNGHQLAAIINDILDLSKVESGHVTPEKIPTKPVELATEVISLLSVMANEKRLMLDLTVDDNVPQSVNTDPIRLKQILTNIVGNAIKFTRVGGVSVKLSAVVAPGAPAALRFDVTDTGVGIPEADVKKLFQVFSQADDSITRKFGGTGLGLVLSKKLAIAMGGDVELMQTKKNAGSTFRISVAATVNAPVKAQAPAGEVAKEKTGSLSDIKVLLVEDSPDNQQLIWRVLSREGVRLDVADNGLEGVEKALAGDYDVVLMDIQMPVLDGYTATQQLRAKGFSKPIVALTAHAMSEIKNKCLEAGCTDHLTKPINFKQLVETVIKYAKGPS